MLHALRPRLAFPLLILLFSLLPASFARGSDELAAVAKAVAATVTVRLPGPDGEAQVVGAGFLDAATGKIVTNAHVVGGRSEVEIGTADGRVVSAKVIARDRVKDVALLAAALPGVTGLSFRQRPARVGEPVYAVGSPFGLGQSVTRGIVSALDRAIDANTPYGMIQHDAALNPGSSGGPVVDADGAVIGINTAMPDGFRRDVGIAYAIPAAVAMPLIADLADGTAPPTRRLGVILRALTPRLAQAIGVAADSGVLVETVLPGSLAAAAGLAPSDVILAIGDTPTPKLRDVAIALDRAAPAKVLRVSVMRGDSRLEVALPPVEPSSPDAAPPPTPSDSRGPVAAADLGMTLLPSGPARVIILAQAGPAAAAGVVAGDTILAVGRVRIATAEEARRRIGQAVARPFALLLRDRNGGTRYVVVDPWASGLDADGLGGNMRNPKSARF